jgi:hypothetical protein
MRRLRTTVALTSALVLLAACGVSHARLVREAEDSFSRGAELELGRKLGQMDPAAAAAPGSDPTPHYALARSLAREALGSEGDLRKDDLYGTARTIEALACWRLGDANAAIEAARAVVAAAEAGEAAGTHIWPRDEGLARAIPALVRLDRLAAMASGMDAPTADELATLLDRANAVRDDLAAAAAIPALARHPLRLWLAESECEAALVVNEALGKADDATFRAIAPRYEALRAAALERLRAAAEALHGEVGNAADLVRHYEEILPPLT